MDVQFIILKIKWINKLEIKYSSKFLEQIFIYYIIDIPNMIK